MSVLPILRWPDPRLSQRCAPARLTEEIRTLANDMLATMYAAPGRGLAAPQVGAMVRLFVMDATWKEGQPDPRVFLNPDITRVSDQLAVQAEACLSLPDIVAQVSRPVEVGLRWMALDGNVTAADFTGFGALCVQHEMDHLDGIVTLDRIAPDDRARLLAEHA